MTDFTLTNEFQDNNISIKVHWHDTMDNYSAQREKEVERYFKNKYKTDKVKVVFKAILSKGGETESQVDEGTVDASEMVLDNNYQQTLIEQYMKENEITGVSMAHLHKLDSTVNTHLEDYKDTTSRYKKFRIKEVRFSNFLSYGDNNKISFDGKQGITSIISDPANYGGKTTATIDVLMFLFFGDTTKTETNAGIFNTHRDCNTVNVRGEIELEGETYIIERTLTRTATKTGDWKVTSSLEFQKKMKRGGYMNLKGDDKKLTEEFIKSYVGNKSDFLITILSTGDNLDELIKTKPTERGRILTRFIGLEFFREKEKICKGLYDEWKKGTKLFKYNPEDIRKSIQEHDNTIVETEFVKANTDRQLTEIRGQIDDLKTKQESLIAQRTPVDTELYKVSEDSILQGLETVKSRLAERTDYYQTVLASLKVPEQEYDIDRLTVLEATIAAGKGTVLHHEAEIRNLEYTNRQLKDSENCPSCKRPLEGVDYTAQIDENLKNIENLVTKISYLNEEISVSLKEVEQIKATKALWDEYNKVELLANKTKFEVDQFQSALQRGEAKLEQYRQNKENVDKNRKIDTDLDVLRRQLIDLEEQKDLTLLKFRGYEKDVENASQRIEEHKLLLATIDKEALIDKIYRAYLDIYGKNGISKMVLSTMMPLINHHLKAVLSETCEFTLEMRMNEKNEVDFWMIDEASGVMKPLQSGSGFEKTVSSLALRCVLTKVCSLPKPNVILFDEVFSRVANDNLEKIGLFFDKIKEYFEHIWLISHNPLITDWADHTIKITKKNHISEIVEG
jgi:DNA repair exonuclease SbcCD ATPase subunit